jgi:crossover junction endodeoxyribonuclease RuvC
MFCLLLECAGSATTYRQAYMSEVILGIDPGTLVMGYGLITVDGRNAKLLEMGILKLSAKEDHAERLLMIYNKMETLMKLHRPAAVAIEAPFFGKNVQSMLKLGRAQGVAIAVSMAHGVQATEYAPRKIKQAITGMGNASKEQVWRLLQSSLDFTEEPQYMDATDAVAVALCHHYERSGPIQLQPTVKKTTKKTNNSWEGFITANPARVK